MYPIFPDVARGVGWQDPLHTPILLGVIVLAGIGTTVLFLVSLVAYRQRRTPQYLLITVALSLLVIRTIVGFGTVAGITPMTVHHFIEHSFDFLIAAIVLIAVYRTRDDRDADYVSLESQE